MPERATHPPIADTFEQFAIHQAKGSSPLYFYLAQEIARDEAMLEIAERASPGQSVPSLLFAAVHYLLGPEGSHPLAHYYSTRTTSFGQPSAAFPHFRDFVLQHQDAIIHLLETRSVQTNEVRRSAYLFPAFVFATSLFDRRRPLALIELGASAGLNLLWDKYQYSYGDSIVYGDKDSPVLVTSEFRGFRKPKCLDQPLPHVVQRIGYDLHPVDTRDPEQVAWLEAAIWPEHYERRELLRCALKRFRPEMIDLRQEDGFSAIAKAADQVPAEALLGIYHTHASDQVDQEALDRFAQTLSRIGKDRDLIYLRRDLNSPLQLTVYRDGAERSSPLALVHPHADWIDWLPEEKISAQISR